MKRILMCVALLATVALSGCAVVAYDPYYPRPVVYSQPVVISTPVMVYRSYGHHHRGGYR